jgi:hypothetical protein
VLGEVSVFRGGSATPGVKQTSGTCRGGRIRSEISIVCVIQLRID